MALMPSQLRAPASDHLAREIHHQQARLEQLASRVDYLIAFSEMLRDALRIAAHETAQLAHTLTPTQTPTDRITSNHVPPTDSLHHPRPTPGGHIHNGDPS